jgi:hypothetical protein
LERWLVTGEKLSELFQILEVRANQRKTSSRYQSLTESQLIESIRTHAELAELIGPRDDEEAQTSPVCSIQLRGIPNVFFRGKEIALSRKQYILVEAIYNSGPEGLGMSEMTKLAGKCGIGGWREIVTKLAKNILSGGIVLPGNSRRGYKLHWENLH